MPKSYFRSCSKTIRLEEHPCQNHNNVRAPKAYDYQSIHAKTIFPFVFQEYTITRASMPKPYFRSCSKSIRLEEHPCQNHNNVRVPKAYDYQSIHAKTIITFVSRVYDYQSIHAQTIITFVSRVYDYQSIHAKTIIPFVFQEHTIARHMLPKRGVQRSAVESVTETSRGQAENYDCQLCDLVSEASWAVNSQ